MKIIKKIIAGLLSLIVFCCFMAIAVSISLRTVFSGGNILKLVSLTVPEIAESSSNSFIDYYVDEIEEEYPEIEEYIDKDKLNKEASQFLDDYLKYFAGVEGSKKPKIDGFANEMIESITKFADEKGVDIDIPEIEDSVDEINNQIEESFDNTSNPEVTKILKVIYSPSIVIAASLIAIICLLLIFVINKKITNVGTHIAINSIISGIIILIISNLLKPLALSAIEEGNQAEAVVNNVFQPFTNISLIFIGVGLILTIIILITKKVTKKKRNRKPKEQPQQSYVEQEMQNEMYDKLNNSTKEDK